MNALLNSLLAVIYGTILVTFFMLVPVFRKFPKDSAGLLVSSCSVGISAACHRPNDDDEAHLLPVQWGVVGTDQAIGASLCAFTTAKDVRPPNKDELLLGMPAVIAISKQGMAQRSWRKLRGVPKSNRDNNRVINGQ